MLWARMTRFERYEIDRAFRGRLAIRRREHGGSTNGESLESLAASAFQMGTYIAAVEVAVLFLVVGFGSLSLAPQYVQVTLAWLIFAACAAIAVFTVRFGARRRTQIRSHFANAAAINHREEPD
jgi:hypothetical protein